MRTLELDPQNIDPGEMRAVADVIRRGGLVVLPLETVYGLAADALNPAAVKRVFAATGRPAHESLYVHIGGLSDILKVAESIPERARNLATKYWPGPLMLVVDKSLQIPDVLTGGGKTVAVEAPEHPVAQALLRELQSPIAVVAAAGYGDEPPTDALTAIEELGSAVDVVLDAGENRSTSVSTVVDVTTLPPRVLRRGTISAEFVRDYLGEVEVAEEAVA